MKSSDTLLSAPRTKAPVVVDAVAFAMREPKVEMGLVSPMTPTAPFGTAPVALLAKVILAPEPGMAVVLLAKIRVPAPIVTVAPLVAVELEPVSKRSPVPVLMSPPPAVLLKAPLMMAGMIAKLDPRFGATTLTVRVEAPSATGFWKSMDPREKLLFPEAEANCSS